VITRRKLLRTGLYAAGTGVAGSLAGVTSGMLAASPASARPLLIATDDVTAELGLGRIAHGAALRILPPAADLGSTTIERTALTDMSHGTAWLASQSGNTLICAMDQAHCFLFDEILRAAHVRVLFKGEHLAMKLDSGAVRHSITELPASKGVTAILPTLGAWYETLMASLALVGQRQWQPHGQSGPARLVPGIRPANARLALATYVLEI